MTFPVGSLTAFLSVKGAAQARQDILAVRQAMGQAGVAASESAVGFDRVDSALANTARVSTEASSSASRLRVSQLQQVAAVERYNKVLADETATLGQVARAEAALIRANERVTASTPVVGAVGKPFAAAATGAEAAAVSVGKFGGALSSAVGLAKSMGLLFGALGAAKLVLDIGKQTAAFQRDMLLIQTQAGASADTVKYLSQQVLAMSGDVATAPADLAAALYHVVSVGEGILTTAQDLKILRIAAEGAKVGNADLVETTNALTATVASGIKGVGDYSQAMGVLNAIVGVGDMKLSDLNEALGGGILATAKNFGVTILDAGAALATFGDHNIRGADAATKLRMSIQDLAKPAAHADEVLVKIGLTASDLREALSERGLAGALNTLQQHMTEAGITGSKVGGFLEDAFTKKAGAGLSVLIGDIGRFNTKAAELKFAANNFGKQWDATTKTASFAFHRLGAEFTSAGIELEQKIMPIFTRIADVVGTVLPAAFHDVAVVLGPIAPLLKDIAVAGAAMWGAFLLGKGAVFVFESIQRAAASMALTFKANMGAVGASMRSFAGESDYAAAVVQRDLAAVGVAVTEEAAKVDRAKATEAEAYAMVVRASADASAAQVVGAENAARAAAAQAEVSEASAVRTATAAQAAADAVVLAGEEAEVGWSGFLGPIGLAAVGILAVVTMFNHSTSASKEATAAAKAYSDAVKSASSDSINNTVLDQLKDNNIPQNIDLLNKALGKTVVTSVQFADAVQSGGAPLKDLEARLQATADKYGILNGKGALAAELLGDLKTQSGALAAAVKKDLEDTKAFAGVASSLDDVTQAAQVSTKAAGQYATMLGIAVDKNGIAAVSAETLSSAVKTVADSYNFATQSGDQFLSTMNAFAQSEGTAADRAGLIGATLKAANGDALNYVGAIASAVDANHQLVLSFQQQAQQLATQSKDQSSALAAVHLAQTRVDELRANSKTKASALEAAENALTKAQQKAATAGALAFKDTEKAAINLKTGMIDASKAGAGPLIQQLQAIQTAAMSAAQAMFQHELATKGAKVAADDAYQVYVNETRTSLIDQATQLGLTKDQAKKLADQYFGMPADVKTTIESEGTDKVVDVLNRIGQLLADFTHQPWGITLKVNDEATAQLNHVKSELDDINAQKADYGQGAPSAGPAPRKSWAGGYVAGPGSATSDSIPYSLSNGEFVMNAAATARLRPQLEAANRSKGMAAFSGGGASQPGKQITFAPTIINPLRETTEESLATAMTRMQYLVDD